MRIILYAREFYCIYIYPFITRGHREEKNKNCKSCGAGIRANPLSSFLGIKKTLDFDENLECVSGNNKTCKTLGEGKDTL